MATLQDWGDLGIETRGRSSGEIKTLCPRCSHARRKSKEPCLSVNLDLGVWNCHNPECGWSGKVTDGSLSYGAIPRRTKEIAPPRLYIKPDYTPKERDRLSAAAREWLGGRGITPEVWERNCLESRATYFPQTGKKTGAIAFPFARGGQVVYVKYRDRDKNFASEKGAEPILYGLDDIDPDAPLVWVEGEMDKLACEVAGVRACVSMPNGAPALNARDLTNYLAPIASAAAQIEQVSSHVIAVDNDAAGDRLRDELVRRLGVERCRIVLWPDGCKDANDTLMQHGAAELADRLAGAMDIPIAGLITIDELTPAIDSVYRGGLVAGARSESSALSRLYTVKPGQITIVSGVPGHGKSALIDWLMVSLAEREGWRFAICSPENQPLERHAAQLIQLAARSSFASEDGPVMAEDTYRAALAWVADHFVMIAPGDEDMTPEAVVDRAASARLRYGINGLVIDPWAEFDHRRDPGMSETEYIGRALGKIRQFARRSEIHVWVIAHPTKLTRDSKGLYPVPNLSDIAGSHNWRGKADMGMVVWRDPENPESGTEVHIQKVRFRECGRIGVARLYFNPATGRYSDEKPRRAG